MKPTKTWKSIERKVAAFFGTRRTPFSGGNSLHTRSDTLHPTLFIETKYRKRHSVIKLWDNTQVLAYRERKIPVIALAEKGREGFWILCHKDDLQDLANEIKET